jgi:heme-degrading monooxygenase HmoA
MPQVFTHGRWVVKTRREDEFIAAWRDFAEWTKANIDGNQGAWLLRDREEPNRFSSFGAWQGLEAVEAWRARPEFQERIGHMQEMLEDFSAYTLDLAAQVY